MTDDLSKLEQAAEKAKPGPWESHMLGGGGGRKNILPKNRQNF